MIKRRYIKYIGIWFLVSLSYSLFLFWFFNTQAPLSEKELRGHLNTYAHLYKQGRDSEKQIRLRGFLAADDGKEVWTLHLVRMRADVRRGANNSSMPMSVFDLLSQWSAPFLWQFYLRASYPVVIAPVISKSLVSWGVADEGWTHFLLMRHRSRRDLMEVVNKEELAGKQSILTATIEKQFTFGFASARVLLMFQPAVVIAWIMFALGLLVHLILLFQSRPR